MEMSARSQAHQHRRASLLSMLTVNLKQIAEAAGVSLATASRVLSGSDYPVKDELRARVLQVAEDLDYVPNAKARSLLRGNSSMVGVIVGDVSDPYFSTMIGGIHAAATGTGYMVTIVNTHRDPAAELDAVRALHAHRVDVLIVAGSGLTDPEYQTGLRQRITSYARSGKGAVLVGRHDVPEDAPISRILIDSVAAGRQMGQHLHELGHRNVALLTGDSALFSTLDRTQGFREILGDGLVEHHVTPTRDGGYSGALEVLERYPQVTAIAATADQMALGALVALRERGIDVPGQMSVAGFNDIDVSKDLVPSLTSMHLPLRLTGEKALELGLAALNGEVQRVHLEATLAARDSTGPARTV